MNVFSRLFCDPLDLITCIIQARKMNGRPGFWGLFCQKEWFVFPNEDT